MLVDDFKKKLAAIEAARGVRPASSGGPSAYDHLFEKYGKEHDVDPALLREMTDTESSFKPRAVSPKNAQGLMQLIPATAKRFGVEDPFNEEQNIQGGTKYIKWLLDRYKGDVPKALAGYNAGEGAVDKYAGIPPYKETQNYVKRITGRYKGRGYYGNGSAPANTPPPVDVDTEIAQLRKNIGLDATETAAVAAPADIDTEISDLRKKLNLDSKPAEISSPTLESQVQVPEVPPAQEVVAAPDTTKPGATAQVDKKKRYVTDSTIVSVDDVPVLQRPRVLKDRSKADAKEDSILGIFDTDPTQPDEDRLREAANVVLSTYGVTPDEIDTWITQEKAAGRPLLVGDKRNPRTEITASLLDQIKGSGRAQQELDRERVETELEEIPPEQLMTKEVLEQITDLPELTNLLKSFAHNKVSKNLAIGSDSVGASTARFLAGMSRWLQPAYWAGTDPDISQLDKPLTIRAYRDKDVYHWIQKKAELTEQQAAALNDGLVAESLQLVGSLPGNLARVMLLAGAAPGGIVTAMSLDMAAQSAGRGEDAYEQARQGVKGAMLGGLAKALVPVTRGWDAVTGSKAIGFGSGVVTTGGGTYLTSRIFGADEKTSLKEALFNTILGMGDGALALRGRTARVSGPDRKQFAVKIYSDGTVKPITLKPGQTADLEIYDANKPLTTLVPRGFDAQTHWEQVQTVNKLLTDATGDIDASVNQAQFKFENGVLRPNVSGIAVIKEAWHRATKQTNEIFHGVYFRDLQADALQDGLLDLHESYLSRGKTAEAKKVEEIAIQLRQATDSEYGDLVAATDFEGKAPELEASVLQEELAHRNNRRSGLRQILDNLGDGKADLPLISDLADQIGLTYADADQGLLMDEAIAMSFRDDASLHFGQTKTKKKELRTARKEALDALPTLGIDPVKYTEGLADVSKSGAAAHRYTQMKQRAAGGQPKAHGDGQAIEVSDFVTLKSDPHGKPYVVHEVNGERAVLVDAYMVDEGRTQEVPVSELNLQEKVAPAKGTSKGVVDEVDIREADSEVPDINAIADYRKPDDPTFARVLHGSRHRFAPEVLVEKPDGTQEYLVGKAVDFPEGTRVTRRGDRVIARYPKSAATSNVQRELYSTKEFLPEIPEGYKVLQEFPLGRFRNDKFLTGEGAMVRGAGHYGAERYGVAKSYRKAGADDDNEIEILYKGKLHKPDWDTPEGRALEDVIYEMVYGGYRADQAIRVTERHLRNSIKHYEDLLRQDYSPFQQRLGTEKTDRAILDSYRRELAAVRKLDPDSLDADVDVRELPKSRGHIYRAKTNISDDQTLVLDKPIADQPGPVKEIIDRFYNHQRMENGLEPEPFGTVFKKSSKTGEDFYEDVKATAAEFDANAEVISGVKGYIFKGKEGASLYLDKRGIGGMKFMDQQSRYEPTADAVSWKGQDIRFADFKGETLFNRAALKDVGNQMLEGRSAETAIDLLIKAAQDDLNMYAAGEGPVADLAFLKTLDPADFALIKPTRRTYNHVIFNGEDIDITGITFALAKPLKQKNIHNKADQEAVIETAIRDFPAFARFFNRRPADAPVAPVDPDPAVEQRMSASGGLTKESLLRQGANALVNTFHSFRREFHELNPNKSPEFARIVDTFRRLSAVQHWSKLKAIDTAAAITHDLGPNNLKTFSRIVQLRDMQREAEKGIRPDFEISDLDQINTSLAHFEAEAAKHPQIQKALDLREKMVGEVTAEMVRLDLLPASVLKDPRYYHRQVLSAIDNQYASGGSRDVRLHRQGFQKERQGEKGDYNTSYLESEVEWLSNAYAQLAKYDIQQQLEVDANIAPRLQKEAKLRGISDWTELIDKKTHTLWQPKEGNYFFRAETIPDKVLRDLQTGKLGVKDLTAEMKEVLGMGRRRPEWVVPKEVASMLDRFEPNMFGGKLDTYTAYVNGKIKQWQLINPANAIPYNLRNAVSDLDVVMARYPEAVGEIWGAYNTLRAASKNPGSPEAKLVHEAVLNGVIDSGQTFAEIPDISQLGAFKHISTGSLNPLVKAWTGLQDATNFRENLLRLAVYEHLKKQVAAGKPVYGGSNRTQVDAITDPTLKAAKVAREFMGDYGGISEMGRRIRRNLMPFYSWMEINAPRYMRMIKNIPHEGEPFKLGPAIASKGLKAAAHGPYFAVRASAVTALMVLWNNFGPYAEHEEKLKRTDVGRQPHLIVGVREDGTPNILRVETALTDAMAWFGAGDIDADINDVMDGKWSVGDKIAEAAKAPLDKITNAIGVQYKLPAELAFGRTAYPSLFEKGASVDFRNRPIKDRWEHTARAFAVGALYRKITGRPQPPSDGVAGNLLDSFVTARLDPDEAVYWNVRSTVSNFAEKLGKVSQSPDPTEKSNALFFYRQALKWDDEEAARRYLDKYTLISKAEGKSDKEIAEGMKKSMQKSHPLSGLDSEKWGEYIRSINQEDRDQLLLAMRFYKDVYDQKEEVGDEKGASIEELYKMVFPKPVRVAADGGTTVPMAVDIYENAGLDPGEKSRVKNAINLRAIQKINNKSLTVEDNAALKRIGINLVTDADVRMLLSASDQQKKAQELKKAAKFGY